MPLTLDAQGVILRLGLALVAGALLGINRGSHGHAAGLRTTVLVCLAACASMVQVNLLLVLAREKQSLVELDLMRLPLGILSGMGFIGAGAILRKGEMVRGVTTAATLWFVTVMGLCFGGGQIVLGLELLGLGLGVLWLLKWVEHRLLFEHRAKLSVSVLREAPSETELRQVLQVERFHVERCVTSHSRRGKSLSFDLCWRTHAGEKLTPASVDALLGTKGVVRVKWEPFQ